MKLNWLSLYTALFEESSLNVELPGNRGENQNRASLLRNKRQDY